MFQKGNLFELGYSVLSLPWFSELSKSKSLETYLWRLRLQPQTLSPKSYMSNLSNPAHCEPSIENSEPETRGSELLVQPWLFICTLTYPKTLFYCEGKYITLSYQSPILKPTSPHSAPTKHSQLRSDRSRGCACRVLGFRIL